jgi:hypothetical protein
LDDDNTSSFDKIEMRELVRAGGSGLAAGLATGLAG